MRSLLYWILCPFILCIAQFYCQSVKVVGNIGYLSKMAIQDKHASVVSSDATTAPSVVRSVTEKLPVSRMTRSLAWDRRESRKLREKIQLKTQNEVDVGRNISSCNVGTCLILSHYNKSHSSIVNDRSIAGDKVLVYSNTNRTLHNRTIIQHNSGVLKFAVENVAKYRRRHRPHVTETRNGASYIKYTSKASGNKPYFRVKKATRLFQASNNITSMRDRNLQSVPLYSDMRYVKDIRYNSSATYSHILGNYSNADFNSGIIDKDETVTEFDSEDDYFSFGGQCTTTQTKNASEQQEFFIDNYLTGSKRKDYENITIGFLSSFVDNKVRSL